MVALPFFDPDETPVDYSRPPTSDFIPEQAPPFDYNAPHYVLSSPKGSGHPEQKLTLSPLPLAKGANPSGMLPDDRPALDPATAGDAWATNEISEDGIPKHYALPTRPGDRPADDATGFRGDAVERYRQTGQFYGGPFDTDERAAEYMRTHAAQGPSLLRALTAPGESEIQAAQPMGDFPDPYVKQYREEQAERARKGEPEPESPVHPREGADAVLRQPATPDLGRALNLRPDERNEPLGLVAAKRIGENVKSYYDQYKGDLNAVWKAFQADVKASVPDEKAFHDANFWDATKMQVDAQLAVGKTVADAFGLGMMATVGGALRVGTKATGQFYHMLFPGAASEEYIQSALDEAAFAIAPEKGIGDFPGLIHTTPHEAFFPYRDATAARPSVSLGDVVGKPSDRGLINTRGKLPLDQLPVSEDRPLLPDLLNRPDPRFLGIARERAQRQGERGPGQYADEDPSFQRSTTLEAPTFFSLVEDIIKKGDSRAPPIDWYNRILRAGGVKAEELETIGLKKWIDEQTAAGRKSIEKQEILDYVRAHNVEIEEIVLGGTNPRIQKQVDSLMQQYSALKDTLGDQRQKILDDSAKQQQDILDQHKAAYGSDKDRELIDAGRWQEANELMAQRHETGVQAQARVDAVRDESFNKIQELENQYRPQMRDLNDQITALRPRINNPSASYSSFAHPGENYRIVLLRLKRPQLAVQQAADKIDAAKRASDAAYQTLVNELHSSVPGLDSYDIRDRLRGVQDGSIQDYRLEDLRRYMPDTADKLIADAQNTYKQWTDAVNQQPRPFTESHWSNYPDIIAHYRIVDVIDPITKERRRVVVEKQSDIHQKAASGRGYEGVTNTPEAKAAAKKALDDATANLKQEQARVAQKISEGRFNSKEELFQNGTDTERRAFQAHELEDAYKDLDAEFRKAQDGVVKASGAHPKGRPLPNLPYKQTDAWTTLITKSVLRQAADEGIKKVSFDVGQTNVDRYDTYLVHHVDKIVYTPLPDGRFDLTVRNTRRDRVSELSKAYSIAEVAEKFGDEIAREMIDRRGDKDNQSSYYYTPTGRPDYNQPYVLKDINQKTGHEGMLEYYNQIGRKAINSYVKKWGKLNDTDFIRTNPGSWRVVPPDPSYNETQWTLRGSGQREFFDSEAEAQAAFEGKLTQTPVRTLDIPDQVAKDVVEKGQPRFQQRRSGPILVTPGTRSLFDRNSSGRVVAELTFTPEMMVQRVALAQNLRERLDALGLHDIALRIANAIHEIGRNGLRVPDFESDGYYLHQIINVALSEDPMGTLNHEVIHAMRDLGLFNKKEWKLLEDNADQYWRQHHKIADAYGHLSEARQREEAIAFAFSKWANDRAAGPQGTFVEQAMKRVQDFIAVVKNGFTGKGFHTVDSIFKNIDTGRIGQRKLLERGLINTDDVAFQRNVLHRQEPFYSEWERFLENPQTQNKASPDDWLNILNKKNWTDPKDPAKTVRGLKPEEIDQTGVREWLERQKASGVTSIPKQQVLDYVKEHNVEIEPLLLGGSDPKLQTEIDDLLKQKSVILADEDQYKQAGKWPDAVKQMEAFDQRIADLKQEQADNPNPPVKHEQYRLGNRANNLNAYQAMLLILKRRGTAAGERIVAEAERAKIESFDRMVRAQTEAGVDWHAARDRVRNLRAGRWDTDWEITYLENLLGKDAADRLITDYQDAYRAHTAAEHKYPPHPPFTYNIHWPQADFLAHFRFETRYINGKKILYVIEGQSDWHQQGKKFGYQGIHNTSAALNEAVAKNTQAKVALEQEGNRLAQQVSNGRYKTKQELMYSDDIDDARDLLRLELTDPAYKKAAQAQMAAADEQTMTQRAQSRAVPNAPFKDTGAWTTLMLKHINNFAAENHYDRVSFDVGQTHADRYPGLERHVKQIKYLPNRDGTFNLQMQDDSGGRLHDQGTTVYNRNWTLPEIAKLFGPEVASKMISRDGVPWSTATGVPLRDEYIPRTLHGIDKKVGTEGMKYSYDTILPNNLKTYLKPWKVDIDRTTTMPYNDWKLVAPDPYGNARWSMEDDNYHTRQFGTEAEARAAHEAETKHAPTFSYDLTPKMVEDVMKGQARFKRRATPYRGLINRTYH